MPDNKKIQQALYDFDETLRTKDYSNEELLSKFPEFNNSQELLDAAFDYSATLNSGKYKSSEEFNDKFPEFFDVKKKRRVSGFFPRTCSRYSRKFRAAYRAFRDTN